MNLLSHTELTTYFNTGRFKSQQTVILTGLSMSLTNPPEYIVVFDKKDVGACWQADIEAVLKNADPNVDTFRTNPNLLVFQNSLQRIKTLRETMMTRKAEFERRAQIIPLFGKR